MGGGGSLLDIAPEVEQSIREYATREGVSVNDLIVRAFPPIDTSAPSVRRVKDLLRVWQGQDGTRVVAARKAGRHTTPSGALFREWEREDALLPDEERRAAYERWEAFKEGINAERAQAGMRLIF